MRELEPELFQSIRVDLSRADRHRLAWPLLHAGARLRPTVRHQWLVLASVNYRRRPVIPDGGRAGAAWTAGASARRAASVEWRSIDGG
jgi:hypothetical protein